MSTIEPAPTQDQADARRERLAQAVADLAIEGFHLTAGEIAFLERLNDEGLSDEAFMARVHEWIVRDLASTHSLAG